MADDSDKPVSLERGIPLADIDKHSPILGRIGDIDVLVIKDGTSYRVVSAKCTHKGAPLQQGLVSGGEIRCPWHHARFCLTTGAAVAAPAFGPLQRFATAIEGDYLFVRQAIDQTSASTSRDLHKRVVIVGLGAGGYACADMLMKSGFAGELTLVSADTDAPYDRTMCSKEYLAGKSQRSDCAMPLDRLKSASNLELSVLRSAAIRLDVKAKTILLASGDIVAFDILVLATGAEPQRPSIRGLDPSRLYMLRTLADTDAIIAAVEKSRSVAVIGAGYIGMEAAASLCQRGLQVHVIAPGKVPLEKTVGNAVGTLLEGVHEKHGVVFHLSRKPRNYTGSTLWLDDGSSVQADFVVAGLGVAPCIGLCQDAGLAIAAGDKGGGVIVNERLQTSVSEIFAIGDISNYPQGATDRVRVEHWVHAQRQGQYVARCIMGADHNFRDIPFFWTAHFQTSLRYLGHVKEPCTATLDGAIEAQDFALTFRDGEGGEALLTCERDLASLNTELDFERRDPV